MRCFPSFIGCFGSLVLGLACAAGAGGRAEEAARDAPRLVNPFFVFCHDTHDAKKRNLAEQAEMVREIGFDGLGHLQLDDLSERLATLDAKGLKLFWLHVVVHLEPGRAPYDPRLSDAIELLRGRDVVLSLTIKGGKMCYGIGGDAEVHLRQSMAAWKQLAAEAADQAADRQAFLDAYGP